ncbi:uncharacterized protein B0I36DRAFT_364647 [Microdochium trichocladiopsis]|uniref:G-patch domain-containing protein n=1 Tax=Microdochium trichocladiopsis TaxID=1682393 RepID=A0A9P8Y3W0_9PEZI|nr:uncharacterized protein B0I36DRAFT_364647 [Microdochium trichocladiopsis]KAH7027447.1 hypothetical protein B0I36DRAFT_364647 [Microdochium trichocladiopsis]
MDAHAYLKSQGWRGTGHSLHPDSDETGLKHHLLIKRNDDGRGLGLKKADHKAEAWWLNAFDQALKGIDVSKDAKGGMKQTLRDGGQLAKITSKGLAKYTGGRGLYNSFVRGGVIEGSVGVDGVVKAGVTPGGGASVGEKGEEKEKNKKAKKTKGKAQLVTPPDSGAATPTMNEGDDDDSSDSSDDDSDSDSEAAEKRRKADKKERKAKRAAEKAERRARKDAKKPSTAKTSDKDEKKELRKAARKAEKKAAKELVKASETREERKARRDVRRKKKEEKRKIAALR